MTRRSTRRGVAFAAGVVALALAAPSHAAPSKARTVSFRYTAPGGVTGVYPQTFLQGQGTSSFVVGGALVGSEGTEDRVEVSATDDTGRPVAVSLYWHETSRQENASTVICGRTKAPLRVVKTGGVQAIISAGEGCPGAVSAPTQGVITFTWTTAPKPRRR